MGSTSSKPEKTDALKMCKARKKQIKQAIDSRYSLAASHVSYTTSLRHIGAALRRFSEAETLITTTTATTPSPSHSSFPSPSPTRLSYMHSAATAAAVTVAYDPSTNTHHTLLRPPPPPDSGPNWDYFDAVDDNPEVANATNVGPSGGAAPTSTALVVKGEEVVGPEREDPSEFITHRAKDFLSSIKDIEHRFFRASEAGKEVGRMLESNKIRVGFAETKGRSSTSEMLAACPFVCCRGRSVHDSHESLQQNVHKVIVWNRSMSSQSSSSRNPLAGESKDDADDSGSECVEDFCMISGSHSSTLDRLYAWERKLYDEVKASEVIRKEYDRKCNQLRHQFAKDLSAHVIDKTRAAVKDLHSRIRVALHSVDSIAKRIEKMRDDELHPQLIELIQGFIRMWKAMLECHHAQYITISLAYHSRSSMGNSKGEAQKQIMTQLQYEFECFGLSFGDWMNSHTSYVEAINGWLQKCVLPTQERTRGSKRPIYPRHALAPPIFVLCRDWSEGIKSLPSSEVSDSIRDFLSDLHYLMKQQQTDEKKDDPSPDSNADLEGKDEETNDEGKSGNLVCIHTSLAKVLDKLNKFSEASLKLYEEIKQKSEAARVAYANPRPFRY